MFTILMGVPRYSNGTNYSASNLFVTNKVVTFDALLRKLSYSFMTRLEQSQSTLIICLSNSNFSDIKYLSIIWRTKRDKVYNLCSFFSIPEVVHSNIYISIYCHSYTLKVKEKIDCNNMFENTLLT